METKLIPTEKLRANVGQIIGLPKNPRLIKDVKYDKLVQSLKDDPEMLELRELIVIPDKKLFVVIGGNMRLQAMLEIGIKEAPCKVLPKNTPVGKIKAYLIKDNIGYGEWEWDSLINDWDAEQLTDWGMDIPNFKSEEEPDDLSDKLDIKFKVEIECETEENQEKIYNELTERGLICRLLTL